MQSEEKQKPRSSERGVSLCHLERRREGHMQKLDRGLAAVPVAH